ncbi:DUF350 domain-containing protein [Fodinicurvata fenggangensis]|uniref:DUF350 domain-containing protein n=1 Tax=Fodinicurvata fenggangensis TaxID=1121830 RepID=UPI00047BDD7A|nr:DUF350 domain-containing protein [Fodinicurvata fenggangensis]
MSEVIAVSQGLNLLWLAIALGLLFGTLRAFDHLLGINFKAHIYEKIESDPIGAGLYFGMRFLAIGIVVAAALQN